MALLSAFVPIYFFLLFTLRSASGDRDKRFVRINPDTPMILGFLWNAPVALILPTLVAAEGDKFDQLIRSGKADPEEEGAEETYVNKEGSEEGTSSSSSSRSFQESFEKPQDLFADPGYRKQTDKLMMLFSILKVPYLECQERIVCEMAFDTYTYAPVSSYMLKELKLNHGPVTQGKDSLMWRYVEAARQGISSDNDQVCGQMYGKCPLPTYKIINMSVVKVLQYFTSVLNMRIV